MATVAFKNERCIEKDGFSLANVNFTENFDRITQITTNSNGEVKISESIPNVDEKHTLKNVNSRSIGTYGCYWRN